MRHYLSLLLSVATVLQPGCIHTAADEKAEVAVAQGPGLSKQVIRSGPIKIRHLIYTPSKLPLEDFFSNLTGGDYDEAFKKVDFLYHPATSDNDALSELLAQGFVPVYVQLQNTAKTSNEYAETSFFLSNGKSRYRAIAVGDLPQEFQRFHVAALGANVFNTGVVIVAVAALLFIAAGCGAGNGNCNLGGPAIDSTAGEGAEGESHNNIYNTTTKTVHVDYKDYLLSGGEIEAKATHKGLVFFKVPAGTDLDTLHLVYAP